MKVCELLGLLNERSTITIIGETIVCNFPDAASVSPTLYEFTVRQICACDESWYTILINE